MKAVPSTAEEGDMAAAKPAAGLRAMLGRGLGAYAFNGTSWKGPLAAPGRLDALVLPIAPATPPKAEGIERLERLVADPAYQLR